jgi:hypothetical protein
MTAGNGSEPRYLSAADVQNASLPDGAGGVLDEVNRRVAGADSLEAIVDFLFEATKPLCPCDRIALAFADETGRRVIAHYARATYEPLHLRKGYAEDLHGSSLDRIMAEGDIRLIDDLAAYLDAHPDSRSSRLLVAEGVRSSMTCPLRVEGRNVGLFFRSSRQPAAYDERTVRMHLAVAERLSQAVEKAYRIERLAAANRAYNEMLAFVTHELKSPVASMMMDATVLADGYLGEITEEQRDKVRRMQSKGRYLLELVEEYLSLARLEGGQTELNMKLGVDLRVDVIDPAVDIVRSSIEGKGQKLAVETPSAGPAVEVDPAMLKIALVNLLSNACKYGREGGAIDLRLETDEKGFTVAVRNEGRGFTPADRDRLFRKFSRLDDPELQKQKGTGVGLYTVWRVVNLHGGRVDAASEPGQWAEFSFRIPQDQK